MRPDPAIGDFLAAMNQTFLICPEGLDPVPAELVEVADLGQRPMSPEGSGERSFSLVFLLPLLGPKGTAYLPQRTYRVEHDGIGALDIFLVPLGILNGKMKYEAIFN